MIPDIDGITKSSTISCQRTGTLPEKASSSSRHNCTHAISEQNSSSWVSEINPIEIPNVDLIPLKAKGIGPSAEIVNLANGLLKLAWASK